MWRRSLQLRVVTTTLMGSACVVMIIGVLLMNQISRGLTENHRSAALQEVEAGQNYATNRLSEVTASETADEVTASVLTLQNITDRLSASTVRGGQALQFAVVIAGTIPNGTPQVYTAKYDPATIFIPTDLRQRIIDSGSVAYEYLTTSVGSSEQLPYFVAGAPLISSAGNFVLYYYFPLNEQRATMSLVQNALLGMGSLLILLIVGIAWLVTRQVVNPVRQAAHAAERLSAGLLEERMAVQGEDDIASLGESFNRMATNLQRQIVKLEEFTRLQRRFTSDVSHELRTPLTTIRMAADVLQGSSDQLSGSTARSAELLAEEVDRFEALLSDLLEISRYDSGAAVLEPEPADMGALTQSVADGLHVLAQQSNVSVVLTLPEPPVIAEVDARRVQRVLRNLIGNAIEYSRVAAEGGKTEAHTVRVTLAANKDLLAVTVRDYGPGFPASDADVVFGRFWRADPSRARRTGGTGLGLSIAKEDAHLHHGWLEAWSQPGMGAQFRLTLPLRELDGARRRLRVTQAPLPLCPEETDLEEL